MAIQKSFDTTNGNLVANTSTITGLPTPGQRKLFNFGERVSELNPEESPFFTYLSKVAKVPTDDSIFRSLENRSGIDWTQRSGVLDDIPQNTDVNNGSDDVATGEIQEGDYNYITTSTEDGISLQPGMVIMVDRISSGKPIPILYRVDSAASTAEYKVEVINNSGEENTAPLAGAKYQVVGSSFGEGSGAPTFFSSDIDDTYGFTQIFKTSCYMSGTTLATVSRGYANEWNRVWNMKLREHKVDIERAMLFGQKSRAQNGSVQHTDGIIGHILRNVGAGGNYSTTDALTNSLSYVAGKPYVRDIAYSAMSYDRWLTDLETIFDPAQGGSSAKLCLAGLPTITWLNKVGSTGFMDLSTADTQIHFDAHLEPRQGAFGHKIMKLDTIHGELNIVKDPLLRGLAKGYFPMIDLNNVSYRPLVGNGINRDTHIMTNVQTPDEDSRKDVIMTEAGLEVTLPETHSLYVFS